METAVNGALSSSQEGQATRRGLLTLADQVDELRDDIETLRRTVLGTGGAITVALLTAAIGTLVR